MRILIVGGGGREHALAWKIGQSPLVTHVFCAPGNAGIAKIAECVAISATDLDGLVNFAITQGIDLTVIGPEAPLSAGIVDRFESKGLRVFGPSADPAQIEGSKVFAKQVMEASGIPTATFEVFERQEEARAAISKFYASQPPDAKIVVKADGLAAGKGVVVAGSKEEAINAIDRMMGERIFGASGDRVILEECLIGEEASIMAITDGITIVPLIPSQDHKRLRDGDTGPNTGGMGAYAPVPTAPPDLIEQAVDLVLRPAIEAIGSFGIPYRGVLYAGIMMTPQGIKVIEFNCRLGDPETQVVLPLLESDLVPLLLAVTDCTLDSVDVRWSSGAAACVVAASGGYPGDYEKGKVISGLEEAAASEGCLVFHAGTGAADGQTVTDGGRVLSVTGVAGDLMTAVARAYAGLSSIHFDGIHYRKDIASRAFRP